MQNTGLMRRLAAIAYDLLLVGALHGRAQVFQADAVGGEPVEIGLDADRGPEAALHRDMADVGFWTRSGRTLGMQSWGLQLETMDGHRPTLTMASLRFIAAIISWAPLGLGFLWQLWDKDKLAWHDRISGTHLVYYPKPGKGR